jgi:SecD/SecF fusion protein
MRRLWSAQMTDLLIAGAVTVTLPVVAFLVWPLISQWTSSPPEGEVLIYQVDTGLSSSGTAIDAEQVAEAIERRINADLGRLAKVSSLADGRIEVAVIPPDESDSRRIEDLLARTAVLEFRVLANKRQDKELVERAFADPSRTKVLDKNGDLVAWWVPMKASEVKKLSEFPDVVQREKKNDKPPHTEVLVVKDRYNVTGVYLTRVEAGTDNRGQPTLALAFNDKGGQLFRQLTGSHLPQQKSELYYNLGVILNGEIVSAPVILGTIYMQAAIAGSFSKQEAREAVSMLKGGGLPAKIRLVERRKPQ